MEIDPAQLQALKDRVMSLAKRHKQIIANLKKDFKKTLEMATKQNSLIKNKAKEVAQDLINEKRKNSKLQIQVNELKSIDSNSEVLRLKEELDQEMARANSFEYQLRNAANQHTNVRDDAYVEVKTKRLEEDLKSEISRSAQMRHDHEIKMEEIERKLRKEQEKLNTIIQNNEKKIVTLEEDLQKEKNDNSKIEIIANEKNIQLIEEKTKIESKLSEITTEAEKRSQQITNNLEEIATLKQVIDTLKKQLADQLQEFQKQNELNSNEIARLTMIVSKYDIVTMGDQVDKLKNKIQKIIKSNDQEELKKTLKETISLKSGLKRQIEYLGEKTLNFHQDVDEFENRLRNRIFSN